MMNVRLLVHFRKSVYDDLELNPCYVKNYKKKEIHDNTLKSVSKRTIKVYLNKQGFSGYVVNAYVHLLKSCNAYRQLALKPLQQSGWFEPREENITLIILCKLQMPEKPILDYKWSERITVLALEKREIDYAMSWLSTLGGAFSAMGEEFSRCAKTAGKISIQQFKLALRLENPFLIARCKLYGCLSLIQQGNLKIPRKVIPDIFKFAIENNDKQLKKMCQGIWAKLKYTYSLRKSR